MALLTIHGSPINRFLGVIEEWSDHCRPYSVGQALVLSSAAATRGSCSAGRGRHASLQEQAEPPTAKDVHHHTRSMRMRTVVQFYFEMSCFRFIGVTSELHLLCVSPCCDHCTAVGELVELLHVGLDGFACLEGICSRIRLFWHAQRVLASVGWGRLMHIEV